MKHNGIDIVLPYPPASQACPRARKLKHAYCEHCRELMSWIKPYGIMLYMAIKFFPKENGRTRGDIDNLLKTILDALKGIVFFDDIQLSAMYVLIMKQDPINPRVELHISEHRPRKNNTKGF